MSANAIVTQFMIDYALKFTRRENDNAIPIIWKPTLPSSAFPRK